MFSYCVVQVSLQVEKVTLPPFFKIPPHFKFFLISTSSPFSTHIHSPVFLSHMIPQVKILEYVTIQKQGPYLQQLHIRLSLFMYTDALRLLEGWEW